MLRWLGALTHMSIVVWQKFSRAGTGAHYTFSSEANYQFPLLSSILYRFSTLFVREVIFGIEWGGEIFGPV